MKRVKEYLQIQSWKALNLHFMKSECSENEKAEK
jgi:hypothetical protein